MKRTATKKTLACATAMDWHLAAFKKYAVFSGRACRKEFWMFSLFNVIILLLLFVVERLIYHPKLGHGSINIPLFASIYFLIIQIPSFAVIVRRLHDTDRTGWWFFIDVIPYIGPVVLLWFLIQDSTPGTNRYGANPKEDISDRSMC